MPHFYSLTLLRASGITLSVSGNFTGPKAHELVVARGKAIELLRPDSQGRMVSVCAQEVFGLVRSMVPFRLAGATVDYLAVGSDSGKIVLLEFSKASGSFVKVHEETFGRSGCRRVVPGEYLACDPKGRALMIAATERAKFVYILNRDSAQQLTISSPLEAHKSHTIVFSICALDVGYENPLFACIEASYDSSSIPSKSLTIYEMDLGVNHVTRKYAEPIADSSHLLIAVPGSADGPGGCLICQADGVVVYKKLGQAPLTCSIPRRRDSTTPSMVVAVAKHKLKDFTLILVQTETGDLFRVDLESSTNNLTVDALRISYFDSLSVRAMGGMSILKSGLLFCANEGGDHALYQFQPGPGLSKAADPRSTVSSSSLAETVSTFFPNPELVNLTLLEDGTLRSLCPLTDIKVMDPLTEQVSGGACQIFAVGGRGPSGAFLRALRYGIGVTELALTELPGKPSGIWTVPAANNPGIHQYIVLSFTDATLVLSVGESVTEVSDSGFIGSVRSLLVLRMHDDSLVQIHPKGVRHITASSPFEWRPREGRQIVHGAGNGRQIVVALTGGEIVYLELQNGLLVEVGKREIGSEPTSVCVDEIGAGKARALFMAVSGSDKSVRVLSLDFGDKLLKQVSAQVYEVDTESTVIGGGYLSIGLANGTLVRCCLDSTTGRLSDARWRFLGVRPVRLVKAGVEKNPHAVFALSSRPWLVDPVTVGGIAPLSYLQAAEGVEMPVVLELAAAFNSEQCANGFVGVSRNALRIFTCNALTDVFSERKIALEFTPRKLVVVPPIAGVSTLFVNQQAMLAVLEADKGGSSETQREELAAVLGVPGLGAIETIPRDSGWGSCVRLVDPVSLLTVAKIAFESAECAVAVCVAFFYQLRDNRPCLVVACAEELELQPKRAKKSSLKTYLYDDKFNPQLVHVTPCCDEGSGVVPLAMCQFEGRLLVSFAPGGTEQPSLLRLYELGKKRLLRKTEYRNFVCNGGFVSLEVQNDRIFAADMHHSVHVLRLNRTDGQIYTVCDDANQRYMSAMLALDYNTILGADKFENLFALRVPGEVRSQQASTGEGLLGTGALRLGPDTAYILDKTVKFDQTNSFHLGDMVTALQKVSMSSGAAEVVMYATIAGAIGVLYPFPSKKEYETFLALEMHLREEMGSSLVGRDHQAFRSYYCPVKGVVDGDLIRQAFNACTNKAAIAQKLGKSENEIQKMIEEIQNRIT